MRWIVFLRAVNVGGANRCRPAVIAKQLAKFRVLNIGAVGTFVVREDVSESALRAFRSLDPTRLSVLTIEFYYSVAFFAKVSMTPMFCSSSDGRLCRSCK